AALRWRGGSVARDDVEAETAQKITRALNRAIQWLCDSEDRARQEVLRDLAPEKRRGGLMPELIGVQDYRPAEFQEKVDWMMDRGFLREAPAYAAVGRGGGGRRGGWVLRRGMAMDAVTRPKRKPSGLSRSYPDLHDHVRALGEAGLLLTVDRAIDKDTEMHPLVRWQFRGGIPEQDRKAFLFTNVVDGKGRKYDIPVLVGGLAANREIYRIGIGCPCEEIEERWIRAIQKPVPPRIVDDAPCHEVVITGKALNKPGNGLDGIPLPISTPGFDIAPYTTLSQYITRDPDTG